MNYGVFFLVCFLLPWNATCFEFVRDLFFPRNPTVHKVRNFKEAPGDEFAVLDTVGLVEQYGYSIEEHKVTTLDDYNIIFFRIYESPISPKKQGKPVIYINHGVYASSDVWVLFGPGKDLVFLLADKGYDVWIGNLRGNSYGRSHNYLSTLDPEFWNFSFHEHAVRDVSRMIDYILEYTNKKTLTFIAFSMGTTLSYILLSEMPEYNDKITFLVSLAPVALWKEVPHILSLIPDQSIQIIKKIFDENGIYDIFPQTTNTARLSRALCSDGSVTQPFCKILISILAGDNPDQLNSTALPHIFSYFPAGGSVATGVHYLQNLKSGTLQKFDFGYAQNFRLYGKKKPPAYDLKKISVPTALIYGKNDAISIEANVVELAKKLQNVVTFEAVPDESFNHIDFLWAIDKKELVYDRVIELVEMYSR